jgi:hypothetical protein
MDHRDKPGGDEGRESAAKSGGYRAAQSNPRFKIVRTCGISSSSAVCPSEE